MVGERAREHCPILPSENSSAPSCRQKATLGSQRATLRTIPHIDVWGFCFSLVSTPPSLLLLVAPHHHLSLTNQLSSTALSSTKCHQPKMSPTNCHQPIATHQVSSTNCHHLSTTNFSRTNQLSPTNHQPIVINQLSSTNDLLATCLLQGVGRTPRRLAAGSPPLFRCDLRARRTVFYRVSWA